MGKVDRLPRDRHSRQLPSAGLILDASFGQAFDPNTGLVQSILAGVSNGVSNQTFVFDSLGRLNSRTWLNNAGASVKENSCFDGLNRLTSTLITGGTGCTGTGAVVLAYDALGNITSKSDICATAGCFAYASGAGPHALTSIAGTYNGVVNPTFAYDANGVMTSGAGRTVTPTAFNMAASIVDGSNTAALAYDTDHARYRMVTTGQNAGTTYYLNDPSSGAMEEKSIVAGVTTWHDYIQVEGRMVAERFCTGAPPCASSGATLNYFVLDHLGSITVITDGAGNVLQRLSYDAWGKRRNADGTALNCTSGLASPSGVNRGFTGQEMIDGVCLINFNARVYDPSIGRFMSPDPIVGDPTVPQELNRFSYVLNDPLSLTDPSGLCGFWCIFRDVLAVAVAIVFIEVPEVDAWINAELGFSGIGAALAGPTTIQLVDAGIAGGLSGLIASGGSLKGAALGALEADLFDVAGNFLKANGGQFLGLSHVPSVFILHGLVGGLTSEISQGNFASGFLSAGVGSLAPAPVGSQSVDQTIEGTIESAALGGVGSVLGGGKFENGAITSAFGYLFNKWSHTGKGPNDQHEQGVQQVAAELVHSGYIVLDFNVKATIDGLLTYRVYDILALDPEGTLTGIEVKTSAVDIFKFNPDQVAFDTVTVGTGSISDYGRIQGVVYFGVCFLCNMSATWSTNTVKAVLEAEGIQFRTIPWNLHGSPSTTGLSPPR